MAPALRTVLCPTLAVLLLLFECRVECWSGEPPPQVGSRLPSVEVVRTLAVTRGSRGNLAGVFDVVAYNRSSVPICTVRAVVSDGHPCGYVTPATFACDRRPSTITYYHLGCQSLYETLHFQVVAVTDEGRAVADIFFSISVHVMNSSSVDRVVASYNADLGSLGVQFPEEMTGKCSYAFVQHPNLPTPTYGNLSLPHRFPHQQPLPCGYQPAPHISYTPAQHNTSSSVDYLSLRVSCWQKWTYLPSIVYFLVPVQHGNAQLTVVHLQKFYLDVHELSDTLLPPSLMPIGHLLANYSFLEFVFPVLKLGGVFSAVAAQHGILDATTFTLDQLEQNTVQFRPNQSAIGGSTVELAYHYQVTDVAGRMVAEGDMEVRVHPRTGKRPSLRTNAALAVVQGGTVEINSSHISLYPPVECANFSLRIVQPTMHGLVKQPSGDLADSSGNYFLPLLYSNDGSKHDRDFTVWSLKCTDYDDPVLVQVSVYVFPLSDDNQKTVYSQVRTFRGYAFPLDHSVLGWPALPAGDALLTVQATAGLVFLACDNSSNTSFMSITNSSLYPFVHHTDIECNQCSDHLYVSAQDVLSQCLWYLTLPGLTVTHSSVTLTVPEDRLLSQLSVVVANQSLESAFLPRAVDLIDAQDNTVSTLPLLLHNKQLPLHNLDAVHITQDYLYVQAVGYLTDEIVIHIIRLPSFGLLCSIYQIRCTESIFTFTQEDIALERIYYQPQAHSVGSRNDSFEFEVYYLENEKLPSTYTFSMGLLHNEDSSPQKQFWAAVAGSKPLSLKFVRHVTNSLNNKKTIFHILDGPRFGTLEHPSQNGSFSFADLQERTVVYHHHGKLVCSDWILLTASDGKEAVHFNLSIAIRLYPKTELSLHTGEHYLKNKESFVLTSTDLQVQSSFCPEFVQMNVIQPPGYGLLMLNDTQRGIVRHLGLEGTFTAHDILQGLVSYVIIPNIAIVGNTSDSLLLTLQEPGTKQKDIVTRDVGIHQFIVYIAPSGNLDEAIAINFTVRSPKRIHRLDKHYYGAYFSSDDFHLWNDNIDPAEPLIVIDQYPLLGQLMKGNYPVNDFSLADIYAGKIRYEVARDALDLNTTSDHFRFSILFTINGGTTTRIASTESFILQWCFFYIDEHASNFINQEHLDTRATFIVRRTGPDLNFSAGVNVATKAEEATSTGYCNETQTTVVGGSPTEDYCSVSTRLTFAKQQTKKSLVVELLDDNVAEGQEFFWLLLTEPDGCIVPPIDYSVWITDYEDWSLIGFSREQLGEAVDIVSSPCRIGTKTYETVGVANILLTRTGGINHKVGVICYTGNSVGTHLATSNDYIPRPNNASSMVYFDPGEDKTFCPVEIINDMENENLDNLYIHLGSTEGFAQIDSSSSPVCVFIHHDNEDTPIVSFSVNSITVQESQESPQKVWFTLQRTGSDLSLPTKVKCRLGVGSNATNGEDLKIQSDIELTFPSGEVEVSGFITILPDSKKEGTEIFYLVMSPPHNGRTGSPHILEIIILDSSHETIVGIVDTHFTCSETKLLASIPLRRQGYLENVTNISCFLEPISATGTSLPQIGITDYLTSNKAEHVIFPPGATSADCHVWIIDDTLWEGPELLQIVITVSDPTIQTIHIENRTATITIVDPEDAPVVQLSQSVYNITEPLSNSPPDRLSVTIVVTRSEDMTTNSTIAWVAENGSAVMGLDYNISQGILHFPPSVTSLSFEIPLLANHHRQEDSHFVVQLMVNASSGANLGDPSSAAVHITNRVVDGVYFPDLPVVMSLLRSHSDDVNDTYLSADELFFDLPLYCITPCEKDYYHPQQDFYHAECNRQGIDLSRTQSTWELSRNGSHFVPVELDTLFASSHLQTLESVYLEPDLFVRCTASAVNTNGVKGYTRTSRPVRISKKYVSCADNEDGVFNASLLSYKSFSGSSEDLLEMEFQLSGVANAIPFVTTTAATDSDIVSLLTHPSDIQQQQQHLCSNLILTNNLSKGKLVTHQLTSEGLSGKIYSHYNVNSCQWHFSLWFPLHILLDDCRAVLATIPYVLYLPVKVAYVTVVNNTAEIVQSKNLTVMFYSNASLHSPIGASPFTYHPTNNHHNAFLQLMSVGLENIGGGGTQAVVAFYSHANFNGSFVSGAITGPHSLQDCEESHAAVPIYSELAERKPAKQAWLLSVCIGNLTSSTILLVSLKACPHAEDYHCSREDIYTFELWLSLDMSSTELVLVRANLQFGLMLVKSSQLHHTNLRHHLAGSTLIIVNVTLDPSQHLMSNHSLNLTNIWVCFSTGDYKPTVYEGGCDSRNKSILQANQLLAVNGNADNSAEVVTNADGTLVVVFAADPLIEMQHMPTNGSWYLHITAAVTSTTDRLAVLEQEEVVPLSLLEGTYSPPTSKSSAPMPFTTLNNDPSTGPSLSPSVPVHAIVLVLVMLVVFLVVCSITSVLVCFTFKQRWLLRKHPATTTCDGEKRSSDGNEQGQPPRPVEADESSSTISKSAQSRQNKSLRFLLYKATELYRQGNDSTAAITIPDKPPLRQTASLPDLHGRNATQSRTSSVLQMLLPVVNAQNGCTTTQGAGTLRTFSNRPVTTNDINNQLALVKKRIDTNSHIEERLPHRTLSRKVSVHSAGWYERHQARQKAMASYAQLYLAAGATTPEPGTSPSTRL